MSNLYQQYNNPNTTANAFISMLGGTNGLNDAMNRVAEYVRQQNMTPEQFGRQLISSGKMSQSDFNRFRMIANAITGQNF